MMQVNDTATVTTTYEYDDEGRMTKKVEAVHGIGTNTYCITTTSDDDDDYDCDECCDCDMLSAVAAIRIFLSATAGVLFGHALCALLRKK